MIKPLLTLSIDFYMRTFVQVLDSPSGSKQACTKRVYIAKCVQCGLLKEQQVVKTTVKGASTIYSPSPITISPNCEVCDSKMLVKYIIFFTFFYFNLFSCMALIGIQLFMTKPF